MYAVGENAVRRCVTRVRAQATLGCGTSIDIVLIYAIFEVSLGVEFAAQVEITHVG
jgi:hypothetical protein